MRRKITVCLLRAGMLLCAALTCLLLLFLIGYLLCQGLPGITWKFLTSQTSYIHNSIGILPNILNTLYLIFVSMLVVIPLGIGAAVYLTEYASHQRLVRAISFAVETLTGIPSSFSVLWGCCFSFSFSVSGREFWQAV